MNCLLKIITIISVLWMLLSCDGSNSAQRKLLIPQFPYQAYLDSMGEDQWAPNIGDDGEGFEAISHKIRYPEMPDTLTLSHFADSLLQCYNIALAFNTMAYDINAAERYISVSGFRQSHSDALDSINVSGIGECDIREALLDASKSAASWIRKGVEPNSKDNPAIKKFYEAYNKYSTAFIENHISDEEFKPESVIEDYASIHTKALADTATFRQELLRMTLEEKDFSKQCVLAREFAYCNYRHPQRNDKEMVAVLDKLLRANKYSPLLGELWRMWRVSLQIDILGSRSNDGAMYNLFYNDMRNRVALVYIAHLKTHPHDKVAFKEFLRLAQAHNITRNSPCMFGNNANLEDMELFYSIYNVEESDESNS